MHKISYAPDSAHETHLVYVLGSDLLGACELVSGQQFASVAWTLALLLWQGRSIERMKMVLEKRLHLRARPRKQAVSALRTIGRANCLSPEIYAQITQEHRDSQNIYPDPLSTVFFSAWSAPFGNPSDSRAPRCQSPPVRSMSANSRGSRYDPLSRSRYPVLREAVWCKTPAPLSRPPPATRSRQARAARFWRSRNSIFPWTLSPSPAFAP